MRKTEVELPGETLLVLHLPPLILHPFTNADDVEKLAAILGEDEPALRLLETSYAEIRMLCFIGKDLNRWTGQCLEFLRRRPESLARSVSEADLIRFLLFKTPDAVRATLISWGVQNFDSVFSKALGLSRIFCHAPDPRTLSLEFIEHFREYADLLYRFRLDRQEPERPATVQFEFALYASREYIAIFEKD